MADLKTKYNTINVFHRMKRQIHRLSSMARFTLGSFTKSFVFSGPLYVQLEPVRVCNYSCEFCLDHAQVGKSKKQRKESGPSFMQLEMAEQLAVNLRHMGTLAVELIGRGEPLLHPQLEKFIEIFRRNNLEVIIYTNGALLTNDVAKMLVQLGVRMIRISINAGTPETHCLLSGITNKTDFEKIMTGAEKLAYFRRQANVQLPRIIYGFVILKENYHEAKQAVQHAAKRGMDSVLFKDLLVHEVSNEHALVEFNALGKSLNDAKAEADRLNIHTNLTLNKLIPMMHQDVRKVSLEVYQAIPCYLPWFFTMIHSNGLVFPCCQCRKPLGDLAEQSFVQIWSGQPYHKFRESCKKLPEKKGVPLPGCECDNCNYVVRNVVFHKLTRPFSRCFDGFDQFAVLRNVLRFKDI